MQQVKEAGPLRRAPARLPPAARRPRRARAGGSGSAHVAGVKKVGCVVHEKRPRVKAFAPGPQPLPGAADGHSLAGVLKDQVPAGGPAAGAQRGIAFVFKTPPKP